jgi:hypothetical protein
LNGDDEGKRWEAAREVPPFEFKALRCVSRVPLLQVP